MAIPEGLMAEIAHGFALDLDGVHGLNHWARVRENGLCLAEQTGADPEILELFAYLHDSQRLNDGWDQDHGRRAADFCRGLRAFSPLCDEKLELLVYACAYHSDGLTDAPITVQTCWDADRLDLGRVGIWPDPRHLCTTAAKEPAMIEWALGRSKGSRQ